MNRSARAEGIGARIRVGALLAGWGLIGLGADLLQAQQPDPEAAARDLELVRDREGGRLVRCSEPVAARDFLPIFDCGDELFETPFNAVDGVGGDVGTGGRFTRVPRYDLPGYLISPPRATGPSAQTCVECHQGAALGGGGDGAGSEALNNIQDRVGPAGGGAPGGFLIRNPPHLFAPGAVQVLAEEMTQELQQRRNIALRFACQSGEPTAMPLMAKGVDFGSVTVIPEGTGPDCVENARDDLSAVVGVDPDLVVRPFGLDGLSASLRSFVLGAFHNELGMEPVEFAGRNVDNDRDGVLNEIEIEDVTAMTVYLAAQPIPQTLVRLDDLRLDLEATPEGRELAQKLPLPTLSSADRQEIARGEQVFGEIGCASCHVPELRLQRRRFAEPSELAGFRQRRDRSPAGIDLIAAGVDPLEPLTYDLALDPPDNRFMVNGEERRLGGIELDERGEGVVRLFGDLRRHDMGPQNAEQIDRRSEVGAPIPASVFITAELWGVGSTAPYLHDGSASTLTEAVLRGHGGEGSAAREAFRALSDASQDDLLAFLNNLVLFFPELEAEEGP